MKQLLINSHRIGRKTSKWFSLLMLLLVMLASLLLLMGNITFNMETDSGDAVNPYVTLLTLAFVLTFLWYVCVMLICFPILGVKRQISKLKQSEKPEQ